MSEEVQLQRLADDGCPHDGEIILAHRRPDVLPYGGVSMSYLFVDALRFIDGHEDRADGSVPFNRRVYLEDIIDHLADKEFAAMRRMELAGLTDDQLKGERP